MKTKGKSVKLYSKPGRPPLDIDYQAFKRESFDRFIAEIEKTKKVFFIEKGEFFREYKYWCLYKLRKFFPSRAVEPENQLFGRISFYTEVKKCSSFIKEQNGRYKIYPVYENPEDKKGNGLQEFLAIYDNSKPVDRTDLFNEYKKWSSIENYEFIGKTCFFIEIRKTGKFTERRISGEWCFVPVENIKADSE